MAKVKGGISRLTAVLLVEKGRTIVTMMLLNPVYAALQALLPAITTACDNADAANQAAAFNGGKVEHDTKRNCEKVLRGLITAMVPQVQTASGGDVAKILSAGFDVVKQPAPKPVPMEPQDFQAVYTPYDGAVKVRWAVEWAALFYQLQQKKEDGSWELVATTTRTTHTLNGYKSGSIVTLRVIAIGAAGASNPSESVNAKAA